MEVKKKTFILQEANVPFSLVAISCAESIHKLAWLIRSQLGIELTQSPGFLVKVSEEKFIEFPVHKGNSPTLEADISLVKNKISSNILLKTHPNIDYVLKISGNSSLKATRELIALFKRVSGVQAAIQIEIPKGKGFATFDLL